MKKNLNNINAESLFHFSLKIKTIDLKSRKASNKYLENLN